MGRLAKAAEEHAAARPGPKCTVGKLLAVMAAANPEDAEDFQALMDSDKPASQIIVVLREFQYEVTRSPLDRHRRRECRCG
jgi:hypothetical protein